MQRVKRDQAFTLIELLIVVGIIAILAAIAVPNFLEAQTRAKVARVQSDFRSIVTAVEMYRVDHNQYPEGTDNPLKYPEQIEGFLGPLASGFYTFRTRGPGGQTVGRDFHGITTPIAYMTSIPGDPFAQQAARFLTYAFRNTKDSSLKGVGWVLSSVGPDTDLLAANGKGDTDATNPLSTAADISTPSRLGDLNEKEVVLWMQGLTESGNANDFPRLPEFISRLSYDPTNGSISNGDVIRLSR